MRRINQRYLLATSAKIDLAGVSVPENINSPGLVLLDTLGHHVDDVVHHAGSQLQVEVALHPLLGDSFGHPLAMPALKLPGQKISQPSLQERSHSSHEEEPDSPPRSPEPTARSFSYRPGVEPVVDDVLEVLAHPDLLHQLVLVSVHPCQLPHVSHCVLQTISKLECVHIVEPVLHVRVHYELGQAQDLTTQVESISKS